LPGEPRIVIAKHASLTPNVRGAIRLAFRFDRIFRISSKPIKYKLTAQKQRPTHGAWCTLPPVTTDPEVVFKELSDPEGPYGNKSQPH
jgi:hypothetical protein